MEKQKLLSLLDAPLLDDLYGYCYKRCANAAEAEDLCADIVLALAEAARSTGELSDPLAFIWKIAHNTYAAHCRQNARARTAMERLRESHALQAAAHPPAEEDTDLLRRIWREIAFLSKAYREVMVLHYLEGLSIADIAARLEITPNTVRQRLFSAKTTVRKEVTKMEYTAEKPLGLQSISLVKWGTGSPAWGNPWKMSNRQFSTHVVWLCRNRPMTARHIADELHVPMPYVEEELELQTHGENGEYGLLRRLDNGQYTTNVILLDKDEIEAAHAVYLRRMPAVCERVAAYLEQHREEYMRFPYINRTVTWNLVLWQQIESLRDPFSHQVHTFLEQEFLADLPLTKRPYSAFGYRDYGAPHYGYGCDDTNAQNLCGMKKVHVCNLYGKHMEPHFRCESANLATDIPLQLAVRAIHGLPLADLREQEQEAAAKAVECGYLYREGDVLYTKILVANTKDLNDLDTPNEGLRDALREDARAIAAELAVLVRKILPPWLLGEWSLFNALASQVACDALIDGMIERGLLTPPENRLGAEGVWMFVEE